MLRTTAQHQAILQSPLDPHETEQRIGELSPFHSATNCMSYACIIIPHRRAPAWADVGLDATGDLVRL